MIGEAGGRQAEPAASHGDGALSEALTPVLAELGSAPRRSPLLEAFARAVLRRLPARGLNPADPAATAAALGGAFDFVDRRPPGAIQVRLIDPEVTLDGWPARGTVMEVNCEDRPFIVTTVREELHRLGQRVVRFFHPVFGSERSADGRLAAFRPARSAPHRESFLQVELGRRVPPEGRAQLVAAVRSVLEEVFAATADYPAMREHVVRVAAGIRSYAGRLYPADEVKEAADLLEWLLAGNFVLAGSCRILDAPDGRGQGAPEVTDALGVLSSPRAPLRPPDLPVEGPDRLLRISRTAEISRVHRQVPLQRVDVVEVAPDGQVGGTFRLVGVFSHKADAQPVVLTPGLRAKLRRILELEDVVEGSQDEATLASLFQALPKEELFEADVPILRRVLLDLLLAEEQGDVRVLLRVEPDTRTVSVLIAVPQEQYTPLLRRRLERFLLAQLDGSRVDVHASLGDRPEAIIRFVVHVEGPLPDQPLDALARELRLLCRTWDEELSAALTARLGEGHGERLSGEWAGWFPPSYREAVDADQAVDDVLVLHALAGTDGAEGDEGITIVLSPGRDGRSQARLKVFTVGAALELSAFLPILESLGLWVVEELPYVLGAGAGAGADEGHGAVHLHDFGVTDRSGLGLDPERDGVRLSEAALALWRGDAEVDALNRLVLRAGMPWQDVAVLRAYRRYRSQVGTTFTTGYVDDVLVEHSATARAFLDLFATCFDAPRHAGPEEVAECRRRVEEACDAVVRLDHDRILRGFLALLDATLRTNRYLGPGENSEGEATTRRHLALKFDSARVPDMPRPVPYREIFVHGPEVEGVHLRWGPVARGGIRWSDRPDDFRSEVLGLVRAQVLKNALIVPTGAKGGFVTTRRRYGGQTDARRAYELFVSSLLEVTDNVIADRVIPVPRRRDGDDPYLVVAADRGTAGFSDLANRLSEERGFWLGDAFASGGSRGYDHKRLGITARGAWVAVRHHFAELDIDLDVESVTVAGIGDMSGDVFGNAMLRSDRLRLVAAFDHRDVFLDPDPDPEASYQERARLFALPGSSWQEYDRTLISAGGGVWSRAVKRVELSPEARTLLDVADEHLSPPELVRAILQAPVALLFAGGIGTFVRASTEPDHEIDDRANADVRVQGSGIRARVVGEGANLAFTQRARIQYARRGGHINTDAIDNSAGVDISDREVNLKILLRAAVEAGELTPDQRDQLLVEVSDEVVAAVLRDCSLQTLTLSRMQAASPTRMHAIESLMVELEAAGVLDRAVEALPTSDEMQARAQAGAGLTRPELAVLLAGAKRSLAAGLLASAVPDQPALREALVSYFPSRLVRRFDHLLDGHRLRRELIASVVANDVVNRMGATFVTRLTAETGAGAAEVAAAYWIARGVSDAPGYWSAFDPEGEDGVGGPRALTETATVVSNLLEALTRDYLRRGEGADIAATVRRDRPAFAELETVVPEIGTALRRRRRVLRAGTLVDRGVEPESAVRWACVEELEIAPDAAELARATRRPVVGVAGAMLDVAEALGIERLVERLVHAVAEDRWSRAAWYGLLDDLDDLRRLGARRALETFPEADAPEAVRRFLADRAAAVTQINALLREVEGDPTIRLDAVAVATRAVRRAIG